MRRHGRSPRVSAAFHNDTALHPDQDDLVAATRAQFIRAQKDGNFFGILSNEEFVIIVIKIELGWISKAHKSPLSDMSAQVGKPPVHLCVVGDDDQSIYQWRGSDVTNILSFTQRYKPTHSSSLATNRRSRPKIIKHANQFVQSITPRLQKKMTADRPAGRTEIHSWSADTDDDEGDIIAETVERLIEHGFRYRDIAVLFRSVRTSSDPTYCGASCPRHSVPLCRSNWPFSATRSIRSGANLCLACGQRLEE